MKLVGALVVFLSLASGVAVAHHSHRAFFWEALKLKDTTWEGTCDHQAVRVSFELRGIKLLAWTHLYDHSIHVKIKKGMKNSTGPDGIVFDERTGLVIGAPVIANCDDDAPFLVYWDRPTSTLYFPTTSEDQPMCPLHLSEPAPPVASKSPLEL